MRGGIQIEKVSSLLHGAVRSTTPLSRHHPQHLAWTLAGPPSLFLYTLNTLNFHHDGRSDGRFGSQDGCRRASQEFQASLPTEFGTGGPHSVRHGDCVGLSCWNFGPNWTTRIGYVKSVKVCSHNYTSTTHTPSLFSSACFLILHVLVSLAIWAIKMNFNLKAYTMQSWFNFLTTSMQQTGLSFTLFWTLFYGLVYLY